MSATNWPKICRTAIRRCWASARALATKPKLLLLDEPLGGMNPEEIHFSINAISKMRERGITILIVEHNMQILGLCDKVVVISFGKKICEGTPDMVRCDEDVSKPILEVSAMSNILDIDKIMVKYGKSVAIHDISISVPEGGVVTLIGSNGAGKSTTLNAVLGVVPMAAARSLSAAKTSPKCRPRTKCARVWCWFPKDVTFSPFSASTKTCCWAQHSVKTRKTSRRT